ncbi:mCG145072, partial [Mus musculus]
LSQLRVLNKEMEVRDADRGDLKQGSDMTDSVFSTHAGCAGAHEAEGYPAEWSCITSVSGDGSQAQQSTCSTDEVYPFGHTRSQCAQGFSQDEGQTKKEQKGVRKHWPHTSTVHTQPSNHPELP